MHGFGLKPEPWLLRSDLVPAQLSLGQPQRLLRPGCRAGMSERNSPRQGKVPAQAGSVSPAAVGITESITEWFGLKGL